MASNYYNNYDGTNDNHDDEEAYRHNLIWRTGDLCVAAQHPKISYIAHQCNCTTRVAQGLAKQIFDTFPSANVYKSLEDDRAGTVKIRGKICNLFAQYNPGKPTASESSQMRLLWFKKCLRLLRDELDPATTKSIAFPYRIGCGLAGGHWPHYRAALQEFAEQVDFYVYIFQVSKCVRDVGRC
jgi:hypothetical protein